jgi:UPF0755 protein
MAAFHIQRQHNHKKLSLWWLLLAVPFVIIIITAILSFFWYQNNLKPVSNSDEEIVITINVGESAPEIGEALHEKGLIRSSFAFDIYTRLNDYRNNLQAGGYKFTPSQSTQEIVQSIVNGDVATDLITILPAQRLDQIRASFITAGYSAEEVDSALDINNYLNSPVVKYIPEGGTLEGYLYPDSYQRTTNTKLETIVAASLEQMNRFLTPDLLAEYEKKGLSVNDAVIIGSIVEREVNNPEDRAKVAQVFLKRYKEGIMLGSDPTALYGALLAGIEPSVFADTPYNTRIYTGLPPSPINNVSVQSLRAVAFPADTEYLFFVSGDDGKTYFSYTLEEHEANTAQHCIELCNSY